MEITAELIEHLSKLSRLELSTEEQHSLKQDLQALVGFFQQIDQADIAHLPEMARPIDLSNCLRPDESAPSLTQAQALSVAIAQEEGSFKVPRVLE